MSRVMLLLFVTSLCANSLASVISVGAQNAMTVTVEITAIAPATVGGVAVLTGIDGGTDVQVLALGAVPETTAIVHRGTCEAIDPAPVALFGDIGAVAVAGQLSKSVPLSLAELTDGNHLIAFHEGLDFSSALACGEIPMVEGVEVAPTGTVVSSGGGVSGDSYTSPTYRYALSWDATWQVEDETSTGGTDTLVLVNNDDARVELIGHEGFDGNPNACIDAWSAGLEQREDAGEVRGLASYVESDGTRVLGGDGDRAWSAVLYEVQSRLALPSTTVHYHECRRISPTAVLEIDHQATERTYPDQADARDDLMSSLVIAENSPPAPGTVTPAPLAPTVAPVPTNAPNPTVGPDCDGVPDWFAATVQRLTRLGELLTELGKAQQSGDTNKTYLVYLNLVSELNVVVPAQREATTPAGVQDLNDRLVAALERYAKAVGRYVDALQDPLGVSTSEVQATIAEGSDSLLALGQVSREVETFAKDCGVKTTA